MTIKIEPKTSQFPKQGDKFVVCGLVVEAQESHGSCAGCFFMIEKENLCTDRSNLVCLDRDNEKSFIYKYVREATDEEITNGKVEV